MRRDAQRRPAVVPHYDLSAREVEQVEPSPRRYNGTVFSFDASRGFGFIDRADGLPRAFVHVRDLESPPPLKPGDRVVFDIRESERGPRAVRVRAFS